MANTSILDAFERMWQHVVAVLGNKANTDHVHDDIYNKSEVDSKISTVNTSISNIINGTTKVAKATSADSANKATTATNAGTATYATKAGTASEATRLQTGRTFRTNLSSTATATFYGTANVTPGVTGTLPIANGGTGATDADTALINLGAAYTIESVEDLTTAFNAIPLYSTRNVWIAAAVFGELTSELANQAHGYMTKLTDSILEVVAVSGSYRYIFRFDGNTISGLQRVGKSGVILYGTSSPSSSTGADGDLYVKY